MALIFVVIEGLWLWISLKKYLNSKNKKALKYVYAVYEHDVDDICMQSRRCIKFDNDTFLNLKVIKPHKHVIWYKDDVMHLCENIPRTNLYKRMSGYQVT